MSTLVVVVIPTYNEIDNLKDLVSEVLNQDRRIQIVVVDDNSPDGTGKLADKLSRDSERIHVLHRSNKGGLGSAYREGMKWALELGADYVIQMDADFSHPPTKLNEMLDQIESHDLVVASRYLQGVTVVNWPIQRLLLSWLGNHSARLITGVPLTDLTGGFRCIRRTLLEKSRFERAKSNGYAFQIELNCRLNKHRPRIKELTFLFFDRTRGDSKLSFATVIEAIWIVWWLRILDITNRL